MEAPAQKVAYCDFELSEMQFLKRYSGDDGSIYKFSPNLLRVEIDPDAECPQGYSFEDYLKMSLEKVAVDHGVKIFVIDNITYLNNETEKASFALPMMRWLKDFRRKYDLSILILAHTPKRDPSRPITKNDLAGSRMTMNFCDASFAIGGSTKGSQIRYIKEIKQRNEPFRYDSDNVIDDSRTEYGLSHTGLELTHLLQYLNGDAYGGSRHDTADEHRLEELVRAECREAVNAHIQQASADQRHKHSHTGYEKRREA
jgi:hypothetical protein